MGSVITQVYNHLKEPGGSPSSKTRMFKEIVNRIKTERSGVDNSHVIALMNAFVEQDRKRDEVMHKVRPLPSNPRSLVRSATRALLCACSLPCPVLHQLNERTNELERTH